MLRSLVRSVSFGPASHPAESVAGYFVLVTLAYFHVLQAAKHSQFFQPAVQTLRPAVALLPFSHNAWISVPEADWEVRSGGGVEVQQLAVSLDAPRSVQLDWTHHEGLAQVRNLTDYLLAQSPFKAICYRVDGGCVAPDVALGSDSRKATVTLLFRRGGRSQFLRAWQPKGIANVLQDAAGITFVHEPVHKETIAEMKSGKWVAYALQAFVVRFWELAKVHTPLRVPGSGFSFFCPPLISMFSSKRTRQTSLWF